MTQRPSLPRTIACRERRLQCIFDYVEIQVRSSELVIDLHTPIVLLVDAPQLTGVILYRIYVQLERIGPSFDVEGCVVALLLGVETEVPRC